MPGLGKTHAQVSAEHHQWCVSRWVRMDRDANGELDKEELTTKEFFDIIREVLGVDIEKQPKGHAKANIAQFVKWFQGKADHNIDGCLSFAEFEVMTDVIRQSNSTIQTKGVSRIWAEAAFALFDLNGDNLIDRSEFREFYTFFVGFTPKEVELQKAWQVLDKKGVHRVKKSTFVDWAKTHNFSGGRAHFIGAPKEIPPEYQLGPDDTPPDTPPEPPRTNGAPNGVHPVSETELAVDGRAGDVDRRDLNSRLPVLKDIGIQYPTPRVGMPRPRPRTAGANGVRSNQRPLSSMSAPRLGADARGGSLGSSPTAKMRTSSAHGGGQLNYARLAERITQATKQMYRAQSAPHLVPWNPNHGAVDPHNSLKPRAIRCYFSRPQNESELERYCLNHRHLEGIGVKLRRERLEKLEDK